MRQAKLSVEEQELERPNLEKHLKFRLTTDGGFMYTRRDLKMLQQSAEAREELFEELWRLACAPFLTRIYSDLMLVRAASGSSLTTIAICSWILEPIDMRTNSGQESSEREYTTKLWRTF